MHSRPLTRNRTKQILRCNNQANERQLPHRTESIEPNDNDLELNTIAYTFSKIDSSLNFNTEYARSFGDRKLLAFSSEANRETEKKNTFSAVEDSTLLRWHSGTKKRVGRTKQKDQIDNETTLFWKSIVKTKHQSLTRLTSILRNPGADRVVRHICIWCMTLKALSCRKNLFLSIAFLRNDIKCRIDDNISHILYEVTSLEHPIFLLVKILYPSMVTTTDITLST